MLKAAAVCLALWLGYQAFIFAYNYNSPFTWGVPWLGSYLVSEWVYAERAEHEGDEQYWLEVLRESEIPALQRPALGSDSEAVQSGRCLPSAFFYTGSYSCPISRISLNEGLLGSGTIVVRNTREFYHFRRINTALNSLLRQGSPAIVEWLAARSDTLPPRRLDPLIYYSLEGIGWPERSSSFWADTRTNWRKMAAGKNPVYRLLALHSSHYWCETGDELTTVYESALHEQNSLFHSTTLHYMRAMAAHRPEEWSEYDAFSAMEQDKIRALFRGPWTRAVEEFQRNHHASHDATEFHWLVPQDVQKTLEYLSREQGAAQ